MTAQSIAAGVPANARKVLGILNASASNGTNWGATVAASSTGISNNIVQAGTSAGNLAQIVGGFTVELVTPQQLYYTYTGTGGTAGSFSLYTTGYEI